MAEQDQAARASTGGATIVKVQVALSGAPPGRGLVYAEGRRNMAEQPLPDRVRDHVLRQGNRKAYFTAIWLGRSWQVNDLAPDQDW